MKQYHKYVSDVLRAANDELLLLRASSEAAESQESFAMTLVESARVQELIDAIATLKAKQRTHQLGAAPGSTDQLLLADPATSGTTTTGSGPSSMRPLPLLWNKNTGDNPVRTLNFDNEDNDDAASTDSAASSPTAAPTGEPQPSQA